LGDLKKWRHQGAVKHGTTASRVVKESTMTTHQQVIVSARVWQLIRVRLAHGRATLRTWQQRRAERHYLRCLLSLDDRLLADIGLNRFAVAWEARRPFWKPLVPDFVHGSVHNTQHKPSDPGQTVGFLPGLGALWPTSMVGTTFEHRGSEGP
jgi:uncharacterized protein YjiS (DUF1127 family)